MLETERLVLRRWRTSDARPFAALNADPVMADPSVGPLTAEGSDAPLAAFEADWDANDISFAAVERRDDGAFLGLVGLARCDMPLPFCPCVEIGWRIGRVHWRRGYATEAARRWLAHGFGPMGLDEIVAFTEPANVASRAVMRRIGMACDRARDFDHPALPAHDPLRPHVLYAIRRQPAVSG